MGTWLGAAFSVLLTAPLAAALVWVFRDELLEMSSPRQPDSQPRRHSPEVHR